VATVCVGCASTDAPTLRSPSTGSLPAGSVDAVLPGRDSSVDVGSLDEVRSDAADMPLYVPEAKAWLVLLDDDEAAMLSEVADLALRPGLEHGLLALYEKCPHLGCRVPYCESSAWFECACHGAHFTRSGELRAGPGPRGLDPLPVLVDDLRPLRHRVLVDEPQDLRGEVGAVERSDPLQHAGDAVGRKPLGELVPAGGHEGPRIDATIPIGECPTEDVGRVLGSDAVTGNQLERGLEERDVAEIGQGVQVAHLFLWRVGRLEPVDEVGMVGGSAPFGQNADGGRDQFRSSATCRSLDDHAGDRRQAPRTRKIRTRGEQRDPSDEGFEFRIETGQEGVRC